MKNSVPSQEALLTFMHVVFGYLEGFIPMRSFAEKGNKNSKPPCNIWVKADDEMIEAALNFAVTANQRQSAFYVIPGVVENSGEASSSHVKQMQVLLIDIDDGDTEGKLLKLSSVLGEPTLIVESGGVTEEGSLKLHVYWQLVKGVSGDDLKVLLDLRYQIALSFGGDTHFKSAHQPIRVAGSVYHKSGVSKLVKIRSYSRVEYELEELVASLARSDSPTTSLRATSWERGNLARFGVVPPGIASSPSAPRNDVPLPTILTTKVFEGSVTNLSRFTSLQRVIGYWLRRYHEGLINEDQAMEEIFAYNESNVVPSWDGIRLKQMIEGIWQKHLAENGEKPNIPEEIKIESIDPVSWIGTPPAREWLIDDWLPRGYVTALYGDGGVGKSLLAQQIITALAIGGKFLNKQLNAYRVYALMCEDDANELWRRQVAINKHYGIKMHELSNIRFVSRVGHDNLLMTFANNDFGNLTKFFEELVKDISAFQPDLVVLDTAADLFGGNENNRPQVRQFIQTACGQIARLTNSAVLLCAHPSESGIQKGTGSGGSTAWNNTVRSRWYLKHPTDEGLSTSHRILSRVKSNYSAGSGEEYFRWDNGVFLSLPNHSLSLPITGKKQSKRNAAERDRKTQLILQTIDEEAACGRIYTRNQFAEKFEDNANNGQGLGSKRNLTERLSIAATQGWIKFFNDPGVYGLRLKKSRYGYICTDTTLLKVGEFTRNGTGEVVPELVKVIPTHKKLAANGEKIKIDFEESREKNDQDFT
jgi:RecA-family ATPase